MKRLYLLSVAIALAIVLMAAPAGAHRVKHPASMTQQQSVLYYQKLVVHDRQQIRHAGHVFRFFTHHSFLLYPPRRSLLSARVAGIAWHEIKKWRTIRADHEWQLHMATEKLTGIEADLHAAWLSVAFTCIHRYEGAWNANTGNGYYGGLQMDRGFMHSYGADYEARWGTANNWPVWAQMDAAEKAYESGRGFWPWPNTARACGLL